LLLLIIRIIGCMSMAEWSGCPASSVHGPCSHAIAATSTHTARSTVSR
jgi:hypothetical protein